MIGQEQLRNLFDNYGENIPRSSIFIGSNGSGRKTFVHWVADSTSYPLVQVGQKADEVREFSEICYKIIEPTIYLIPDIEQMSATAQNALLKILEEPPNNAYLMLTAAQENVVLPTIISRCVKFYLSPYSELELIQYAKDKYKMADDLKDIMLQLCVCPGDIDLLFSQNIPEFMAYVQTVFKNIAVVSGANSFKIANKINLADDTNKYDLSLFWRAFTHECFKNLNKSQKYLQGVIITQKHLQDLRIKGINRSMLFDNWLLEIRRAWL